MDYGVLLRREPIFPLHVKPKEIDAVVITHAHLDHSGFVPALFLNNSSRIEALATLPTLELGQLLIEDMIKISGFYLPFEYSDLANMLRHSRIMDYKEKHLIKNIGITLHEAGHVLGGSSVIV